MSTVSEEKLQTYRATCRRRDSAERRRQHEARQAGMEAARRVTSLLREQFGAERVVLFGSLARGENLSPRSDIDMAVKGISPDEYYRAVAQVQHVAGEWAIDLVLLDDCPSSLRERIDTEGISL